MMKASEFKFLDSDGNTVAGPKRKLKPVPPTQRLKPGGVMAWHAKFRKLCRKYGKKPGTVKDRVNKQGYSLRDALRKPLLTASERGRLNPKKENRKHSWRVYAAVGSEKKQPR